MAAYGRKQPFGLSLNRPSLTSALEKKADIRVLELRARLNGRNRPEAAVSKMLAGQGVNVNTERPKAKLSPGPPRLKLRLGSM